MNGETLQMLELVGWVVLMYWLLTATKSATKAAADAKENADSEATASVSDEK
jgi:hypothetical protein